MKVIFLGVPMRWRLDLAIASIASPSIIDSLVNIRRQMHRQHLISMKGPLWTEDCFCISFRRLLLLSARNLAAILLLLVLCRVTETASRRLVAFR